MCAVRFGIHCGGWDEALETGSVYLSYSLQSGKETLCTTRNQANIKDDWMSTMSSLLTSSLSNVLRCEAYSSSVVYLKGRVWMVRV
jgi:hypothetical protein